MPNRPTFMKHAQAWSDCMSTPLGELRFRTFSIKSLRASTWRPFGSNLHTTYEKQIQIEVILEYPLAQKTTLEPHRAHFGLLRGPKVPKGTPKASKVIPKWSPKHNKCSKMHVQCSLCTVCLQRWVRTFTSCFWTLDSIGFLNRPGGMRGALRII